MSERMRFEVNDVLFQLTSFVLQDGANLTRIASEVRVLLVSSHYGIANDEYAGRLNFVTVSVRRRGQPRNRM